MISLKKYLESARPGTALDCDPEEKDILPGTIAAYSSALREMGSSSVDACPALGEELRQSLGKLAADLSIDMSGEAVAATERSVREQLRDWGRRTAGHYRQKTGEVKELLIVMARTAESVGERDQRCAGQISEVTARLERIASLEDLTEIRASIEQSAAELKTSVDRMATEGREAVEKLRVEVANYQTKLEEAEETASRDALTGLRNRLWVEGQIERRVGAGVPFCVAIVDVDGFKKVNDDHGHLVGDELLRQFATELQSASRSTDLIGRWGGDEFILVLDGGLPEARAQIDRLSVWVCGSYKIQERSGPLKLTVTASIGLAEHVPDETMKDILAQADAAMYVRKAASRANGAGSGR
jgi:diguanylate cyclase (GGDEF)-like protein